MAPLLRAYFAAALLSTLAACGGGGGGSSVGGGASPTNGDGWIAGVYQPSSHYAALCQNPRSGTDPVTGRAYPDSQGTTLDENNFLRSWTNELYLWYSEVPDVDPGTYSSTSAYFDILKTTATTSTGHPKDRFHFTYSTASWEQLSGAGVDIGYGVTWDLVANTPPRQVYAGYVWTGTSAAAAAGAGVARGWEILSIDGADMINATDQTSINTLNAGLTPTSSGELHAFVFKDGSDVTHNLTLQAAAVTETPVPVVNTIATAAGQVGYLLFNSHIATSEQELIAAINQLKSANVTDLVLDLRYNGGGYLDIASELAYMIAGPGPTAGQPFEKQVFNNKHPNTNPVTGMPLTPTPFHTTTQGYSTTAGAALPYLGLPRVFVLTGPGTCSASEAIINGLNGVNVQVIQVGSTTCGKPYGFYPQDNCGTTYFSIEFQGDNAQSFGSYPDGFSPQNSVVVTSAVLPGCSVADDFTHALGDSTEGRLAAALNYAAGQSCPSPPTGNSAPPAVSALDHQAVHRAPWRENRILQR
jgi:carboxyl-terminal processing protease